MGPPPDVPTPSQKTDAAGFVQALFAKAPPDTLIEYRCLGGGETGPDFRRDLPSQRRHRCHVERRSFVTPPFGPTAR